MGSRPPGCVVVPRGTRGAPIFAQNLDHVVFDMRDGIAPRRIYWQTPLRWNRDAQAAGRGTACSASHPSAWRADLWHLIRATPAVNWFCLRNRPQNIAGMLPAD